MRPVTAREAWYETRTRESRNPDGAFTRLTTLAEKRGAMADGIVEDAVTGEQRRLGEG